MLIFAQMHQLFLYIGVARRRYQHGIGAHRRHQKAEGSSVADAQFLAIDSRSLYLDLRALSPV